jgi:RNA polymerase sigma factor (sigma-70 family)
MDDRAAESVKLVSRAAAGDRSAFTQLINLHERQALAVAYATVGCAATAADVVQDAMLRAWQRLKELDDPARFASWLCRIVRNLSVDSLRRKPRAEADVERLLVVPAASGGDDVERGEIRAKLDSALGELDDLTRMAVTLRYYDNLSSKQIGELIGLSSAAVDMRLSRARGVLREKLAWLAPDTVECGNSAASGGAM